MAEDTIVRLIDEWSDDIIRFTEQLVATPSVTPPGDEREIAQLLLGKLDRLGLDGAAVVGELPERPNVVYRLKGAVGNPILLYVAHTDTKPVGDAEDQWVTNPFQPEIKRGRLYGLGASDMKAAVAAFVYAVAALKRISPLRGDLVLALVADEEGGGRYGAQYLASKYGLKADMAVIGEPSGISKEWEYLHLGCRGICCFTIIVHGTQMHSSLSDRLPTVNASLKLAALMTRMSQELKFNYVPHPFCPGGVTLNLGVRLRGGVFYGVYPGRAEFSTDIRTVPGMTKDSVIRDLENFLELLRKEDPSLKVDLELAPPPLDWIPPTEVSADLPIVKSLVKASDRVLGQCPPFSIYPAATDSSQFQLRAGIPTVASYGPGMISVCHAPNEWVGVRSIIEAAKIYALAAYDVLRA